MRIQEQCDFFFMIKEQGEKPDLQVGAFFVTQVK
jgi:hypothetical protein